MYNRVTQVRKNVNRAWYRGFKMVIPFNIHYYNKHDLTGIIPDGVSFHRGFTIVRGRK